MVQQNRSGLLHADVGEDISLTCDYKLEDDILYSIKWYRDDKEFFRFIPRGEPRNYSLKKNSLTLTFIISKLKED